MIKHDHGVTYILVHCTRCPYWHASAFSKLIAHLEGAEHERTVHPKSWKARRAAHQYAARHAAEFLRIVSMRKFAVMVESWDFSTGSPQQPS